MLAAAQLLDRTADKLSTSLDAGLLKGAQKDMSNLSVAGDFRIAAAITEPILTSAPSTASSTQKNAIALYPQLTPHIAASSLAQLNKAPVTLVQPKGYSVMQQVQPKGSGSAPSPSSGCDNGVLAEGSSAVWTGVGAVGEAIGKAPDNTSTALGEAGRYAGAGTCEAIDGAVNVVETVGNAAVDAASFVGSAVVALFNPDHQNVPTEPANPNGDGGLSSGASYIDPTTGEQITNKDGKTIAGDPNADPGTDIGEVDNPASGQNQSTPSQNSSEKTSEPNQSTATDTTTPEPAQPEDTPATGTTDPGPKPDGMPADDGSGSNGPAGPRSFINSSAAEVYMPADDSVGGGTPRSNAANVANAANSFNFNVMALSRSYLT